MRMESILLDQGPSYLPVEQSIQEVHTENYMFSPCAL